VWLRFTSVHCWLGYCIICYRSSHAWKLCIESWVFDYFKIWHTEKLTCTMLCQCIFPESNFLQMPCGVALSLEFIFVDRLCWFTSVICHFLLVCLLHFLSTSWSADIMFSLLQITKIINKKKSAAYSFRQSFPLCGMTVYLFDTPRKSFFLLLLIIVYLLNWLHTEIYTTINFAVAFVCLSVTHPWHLAVLIAAVMMYMHQCPC